MLGVYCRSGIAVFDVVGIGIVRDLEIVAAQRGHQAKLVGGVGVEDEGPETADDR